MPAKSKSQFRFLQNLIHNGSNASTNGLTPQKAQEFISSTPNYNKLPETAPKKQPTGNKRGRKPHQN
jgi:hypothetical protein